MMISCLPKGVCSWDFVIQGDGILAEVNLSTWKEHGTFFLNGQEFDVSKSGVFSGEWILSTNGSEIASASKVSVFKRTLEISKGMDEWLLKAESALGRSFLILRSNEVIGRISPVHPFTRRATIEMELSEYDTELLAFSFWLVILMWRRAASNG